jgi:branched-chain amino acid transport system ATP-binding protein
MVALSMPGGHGCSPAGRARRACGGRPRLPRRAGPGPLPGRGGCPGELSGVAAPLLTLRNLSKAFGGVAAVGGVSTVLAPGEIRGLIGPNGSGKTTLLNLIGGQLTPDVGEIFLDGRPIHGFPPDRAASLGVARTFQLPRVFRHMTVLDNLLLPACADHRRVPWATGVEEAWRSLRFVGLERFAHADAQVLSGGQAMLLQLARGLIQQPLRLCLLDEPFAGVHPAIKDRMLEAILDMNRRLGVTFLVVSHEMTTLRRLAGRVSVMHNGWMIAEGTLEAVARDARVIEAYLGGRQVLPPDAARP